MSEDKFNVKNIVSFIVALLIVGTLLYFIYSTFNKVSVVNPKDGQLSIEELNKLGKEKYVFVSSKRSNYDNSLIFYKDNVVNLSNMDNNDILTIAYTNISNEDRSMSGTSSNDCFLNNEVYTVDNYPSTCQSETFDKNVLQEQVVSLFGSDAKVDYTDFNPSGSMTCYLKDKYYCYLMQHEVNIESFLTLTSFISAQMEENNLVIYSYLISIRKFGSEAGIYSDASATNKIGEYDSYLSITRDKITEDSTNKLIDKYKDKLPKYKTVFTYDHGNYVFKSNEKVSN